MNRRHPHSRGMALLVVIATVIVVMILAIVILQLISSSSRLTHHQVSRIQAIYAVQAALAYAQEMVRQGNADWIPSPDISNSTKTRRMCGPSASPACAAPNITEPDLPISINDVTIVVGGEGSGTGGTGRFMSATANFTYTP